MKITKYIMISNAFLGVIKILAGVIFSCFPLMTDGVHNFTDVSVTALAGSNFKGKRLIFRAIINLIGVYIIVRGVFAGSVEAGGTVLAVTCFSILVKECLFYAENAYGKRVGDGDIITDSWHQRADSIVSLGVLLGLLLSKIGFVWAPPLSCVFAGLSLIKVANEKRGATDDFGKA